MIVDPGYLTFDSDGDDSFAATASFIGDDTGVLARLMSAHSGLVQSEGCDITRKFHRRRTHRHVVVHPSTNTK